MLILALRLSASHWWFIVAQCRRLQYQDLYWVIREPRERSQVRWAEEVVEEFIWRVALESVNAPGDCSNFQQLPEYLVALTRACALSHEQRQRLARERVGEDFTDIECDSPRTWELKLEISSSSG